MKGEWFKEVRVLVGVALDVWELGGVGRSG